VVVVVVVVVAEELLRTLAMIKHMHDIDHQKHGKDHRRTRGGV